MRQHVSKKHGTFTMQNGHLTTHRIRLFSGNKSSRFSKLNLKEIFSFLPNLIIFSTNETLNRNLVENFVFLFFRVHEHIHIVWNIQQKSLMPDKKFKWKIFQGAFFIYVVGVFQKISLIITKFSIS